MAIPIIMTDTDTDTDTDANSNKPKKEKRGTLEEEVTKAFETVTVSKFRTEELHGNWRAHLQRLAVGVTLLTMHQYSQPVRDCILDMKSSTSESASLHIPAFKAMQLIVHESWMECINLIIAILHVMFLRNAKVSKDFSDGPYFLAAVLVPLCVGLFFHTERVGCMVAMVDDDEGEGGEEVEWTVTNDFERDHEVSTRQFPVAVLYHMIVTVCVYIMNKGMAQCDQNIAAIERLRTQLLKKPKNGGSGGSGSGGGSSKKHPKKGSLSSSSSSSNSKKKR